jgi:hypothetical protein
MSFQLNQEFGNIYCGSLAQATQSITGAGATSQVSPSVGFVFVNATAAGQTLVLPLSAVVGQMVTVLITAGTNAVVISEATGSTILGATVSISHAAVGARTSLVYVSAALGWAVVSTTATLA